MSMFIASPGLNPKLKDEIGFLLFAQGNRMGKGSRSLFETILREFGIEKVVKQWNLKLCRSNYFSDYPDSEDWRDRWRLLWDVTLKIDNEISDLALLPDIFLEIDVVDETWTYQDRVKAEDLTTCLVIADFESSTHLENCKKALSKELQGKEFQIRSYLIHKKYWQLIVDLGVVKHSFYEQESNIAKAVQSICELNKGTCHYLDKFP